MAGTTGAEVGTKGLVAGTTLALAEGGRWRLFSGEEGDGGRAGREEGGGGLAGLGGLGGLVGLVVSLAGLAGSGLRGEGSVGCGDEMREGGETAVNWTWCVGSQLGPHATAATLGNLGSLGCIRGHTLLHPPPTAATPQGDPCCGLHPL